MKMTKFYMVEFSTDMIQTNHVKNHVAETWSIQLDYWTEEGYILFTGIDALMEALQYATIPFDPWGRVMIEGFQKNPQNYEQE